MSANIMYSGDLAMKIYAGADMFLMPSQMEPCGLSQMIAMRYGTVPIVRQTGGLNDSVTTYNPENGEGSGFTFSNFDADDMMEAIRRACDAFHKEKTWDELVKKNMLSDFSWGKSAELYRQLYHEICAE